MLSKHFTAALLALTVMLATPAQAEEEIDCGHPQMKEVLTCQQGIAYLEEEAWKASLPARLKFDVPKTAPKTTKKQKLKKRKTDSTKKKIDFSNIEESFSVGNLY